jgi:DHA1 family inner membrane transport protein
VQNHGEHRSVAAAIALVVAGGSSLLTMPVLVSSLVAAGAAFSSAASGFAALQSWSISAGCVASIAVGRRFPRRALALSALSALVIADLLSANARSGGALLWCRAIAGVFGGLSMSLSTAMLVDLPAPERNFGLSVLAQLLFTMVSTLLIPQAAVVFGLRGTFGCLVAVDLLALLTLWLSMPAAEARPNQEAVPRGSAGGLAHSVAVLSAIVLFFTGIGACWPFVGRIGAAAGLNNAETGRYLSLAALAGIAGSLAPAFVTPRLGRAAAIIFPFTALLGAMTIMVSSASPPMFFGATALYYFGWYGLVPCLFALLAAVDRDGRPSLASMALVSAGIGIGSQLASQMGVRDFVPGIEIGIVATILSVIVCFVVMSRVPQQVSNSR